MKTLSLLQKNTTDNLKSITVDTTQKFTDSLSAMQTVLGSMLSELSKLNDTIERNTPKVDPTLRRLPNMQEGNIKLSNNSKTAYRK